MAVGVVSNLLPQAPQAIDKSDWTVTAFQVPPEQRAFIKGLAQDWGVTQASIVNLAIAELMARDEGWLALHLPGARAFMGGKGRARIHSPELDKAIIDAAREGWTQRKMGEVFGFSSSALARWLGQGCWKDKRREPFASRFEAARQAARQERNRS